MLRSSIFDATSPRLSLVSIWFWYMATVVHIAHFPGNIGTFLKTFGFDMAAKLSVRQHWSNVSRKKCKHYMEHLRYLIVNLAVLQRRTTTHLCWKWLVYCPGTIGSVSIGRGTRKNLPGDIFNGERLNISLSIPARWYSMNSGSKWSVVAGRTRYTRPLYRQPLLVVRV